MEAQLVIGWLQIVGVVVGLVVSMMALHASKRAVDASTSAKQLDEKIELSLQKFQNNFKEDLTNIFASKEVLEYRFRGIDDKYIQLDHRITRNQDQTTLMLNSLLNAGVVVKKKEGESGS